MMKDMQFRKHDKLLIPLKVPTDKQTKNSEWNGLIVLDYFLSAPAINTNFTYVMHREYSRTDFVYRDEILERHFFLGFLA